MLTLSLCGGGGGGGVGYTPVYGILSMKIDEIVDSSRILDEIVDSSQWLDENVGYFYCW